MRLRPQITALLALFLLALHQPAFAQPDGATAEDAEGFDDEASTDVDENETTKEPPEVENVETEAESLDSLRDEYFKLRDRLFQSRARASAVSSALYSTRLSVQLGYDSARYYTVTRATIRLDGANIYDDSEGKITSDKSAPRFEGYIAPGRHQLSIRIEATGKDDDRFTSIIENSFTIQATKGKDLEIKVSAKDGGNIPYNWSRKEKGSYKLHLDVSLKSVKRRGKKKKGSKASVQPRTPRKAIRG